MPAYRAVPRVLRNAASQITEVAAAWEQAATSIRAATLAPDDYGLLGRALVTTYNQSVQEIVKQLDTGHQSINNAATTLDAAATGYENLDFKYYKKFGYLAN